MGEEGGLKIGDTFKLRKLGVGLIEHQQEWHASCPGIHDHTRSNATTSLAQHVVNDLRRNVTGQPSMREDLFVPR
jgi:hypothetical protein